jgi:hypothetical protein
VNVVYRIFSIKYVNYSGSAFIIEVDGRQYLITAKHVLPGMEGPAQIRLRVYDGEVYDRWV